MEVFVVFTGVTKVEFCNIIVIWLIYPQRTDEFDLYLVFSPLVGKLQVIQAGNNLIKWIKVSNS